jgi:hypothetical protein
MSIIPKLILVLTSISVLTHPVIASDVFVYPTKGQNKEQQSKDESECHSWSVGQTNFDPSKPTQASTPAPQQQQSDQGGVVQGGARGAAVGAVGGAIGGNAGKGAAIGAAAGGVGSGLRNRNEQKQQKQAQQDWESQQTAELEQKRATFNRAYTACLEGRGYTIK